MTDGAHAGGRLRLVAVVIAAVFGLGVSVYLTAVHYAHVPLACTTGGVVDCASVTTSSYSVVPGTSISITIPGMLWFLVSGSFAGLGLWRSHRGGDEPGWLWPLLVAWGLLGLLVVLRLVYVEIVILHRICEWCTVVHVLILVTFLIALARLGRGAAEVEDR